MGFKCVWNLSSVRVLPSYFSNFFRLHSKPHPSTKCCCVSCTLDNHCCPVLGFYRRSDYLVFTPLPISPGSPGGFCLLIIFFPRFEPVLPAVAVPRSPLKTPFPIIMVLNNIENKVGAKETSPKQDPRLKRWTTMKRPSTTLRNFSSVQSWERVAAPFSKPNTENNLMDVYLCVWLSETGLQNLKDQAPFSKYY